MKNRYNIRIKTCKNKIIIPSGRLSALLVFFTSLLLPGARLSAQLFDKDYTTHYDTSYIRIYKDELTTRVFLSNKQNLFVLSENMFSPWLRYKTTDRSQAGIGYTYSFLTLNVGVKLPDIRNSREGNDESSYLDLQVRTNFRNTMVDIYLQWTRGYYLSNISDFPQLSGTQPLPVIRNDIRTSLVGINIQHLFNSDRYSYKASFVQNEFQKRSAGSPIIGLEGYWMLGLADSVFVPPPLGNTDFAGGAEFNQADLFCAGFNAGYAHTFVIKERLYLSLSATVGITGGTTALNNTATSEFNRTGFSAGITNHNRISLGFNKNNFYTGISYVQFNMSQNYSLKDGWFRYSTGNIRFNVVKRFKLNRPIRILRPDLWNF